MRKLLSILMLLVVSMAFAQPNITLTTKKAFPGAFGAGADITGGRGQSIYAVTNLNDTGAGSYRDAVSQGNRLIIIKVEGIVNTSSQVRGYNKHNVTVWGQFAPGRGLTVSGNKVTVENVYNNIYRFVTYQNGSQPEVSSFARRQSDVYRHGQVPGIYMDHLSTRYGTDQILDATSRESQEKNTIAYCMIAEGQEGHNTGTILGNSGGVHKAGQTTFARNMYYNVSHRHPNIGGQDAKYEIFNNYIANWQQRMSSLTDSQNGHGGYIDYFKNYAEQGNHNLGGSNSVNKVSYNSNWGTYGPPVIYSDSNYVEAQTLRLPVSAPQKNVWAWRKTIAATFDGDPVNDNEQIDSPSMYSSTKQLSYDVPSDGVWNVYDVPAKVRASVGHNRGINADGSPGFFRDDKDTDYVTKMANGTSETNYRLSSTWDDSSFTATALYADTDGDYMPNWFENQHAHLNPNSAADRDTTESSWDFTDYTVTNTAGYTNLEMCAAFYAGDFETILDGTNDFNTIPTATCSDGVQNGDETGVDCGGSCTSCSPSNSAPTAIHFFDNNTSYIDVVEGTVSPAMKLTSVDVDADTHTYSILSGNFDHALFSISNDTLTLNITPDYSAPVDTNTNNVYRCDLRTNDGNGGTFDDYVLVTITEDPGGGSEIPVSYVNFDLDEQIIYDGETANLDITWTPSNATDKGYTLTSSNNAVLTDAGVFVSEGTAVLTITADDNTNQAQNVMNVTTLYKSKRTRMKGNKIKNRKTQKAQ